MEAKLTQRTEKSFGFSESSRTGISVESWGVFAFELVPVQETYRFYKFLAHKVKTHNHMRVPAAVAPNSFLLVIQDLVEK